MDVPTHITPSKKRRAFDSNNYVLTEDSPTFDTRTPRGKGVPQSRGVYQPIQKVAEQAIYHAEPLKLVPLTHQDEFRGKVVKYYAPPQYGDFEHTFMSCVVRGF